MYRVIIKSNVEDLNDLVINRKTKEEVKELSEKYNAEIVETKFKKIKVKNHLKQNTQDFLHEYLKK